MLVAFHHLRFNSYRQFFKLIISAFKCHSQISKSILTFLLRHQACSSRNLSHFGTIFGFTHLTVTLIVKFCQILGYLSISLVLLGFDFGARSFLLSLLFKNNFVEIFFYIIALALHLIPIFSS